jgi:hypothetical protein
LRRSWHLAQERKRLLLREQWGDRVMPSGHSHNSSGSKVTSKSAFLWQPGSGAAKDDWLAQIVPVTRPRRKARHSGVEREHSDINLMLYSDDEKAVLLCLPKHNFEFEDGE